MVENYWTKNTGLIKCFEYHLHSTEEPTVVDNSVVDRPILPPIPMTQTHATATAGDILDDGFDDELLLAIDGDQMALPQPQQQPQPQPQQQYVSQVQLQENFADSFSDLDENAFSQIDELVPSVGELRTKPAVTISVDVAATVRPDMHNANRLSSNPVEMPQRKESICNDNYAFKIRAINLVFIQQLNTCPSADKLRRRFFMIKAKIVRVAENAQVKRDGWSLGVILTDDVTGGQLRVRFHNDVLEKLSGATATEIRRINAARKVRPHVTEDLQQVNCLCIHSSAAPK